MRHRTTTKISLATAIISLSIASPVRAVEDTQHEDALIAAFLVGDMTDWEPSSFCFNTTLRDLDATKIERLQRFPGPDRKSGEELDYLKDLNEVARAVDALPSRVASLEARSLGNFRVRPAAYAECESIPTFRLNRAMMSGAKALLSGVFVTPCGSIPFGLNLLNLGPKWEKKHTAYYYAVPGLPGCSYLSKAHPGEPADTYLLFER